MVEWDRPLGGLLPSLDPDPDGAEDMTVTSTPTAAPAIMARSVVLNRLLRCWLLIATTVFLAGAFGTPASGGRARDAKITICHHPDERPFVLTLEVGGKAAQAHLAHGDFIVGEPCAEGVGACRAEGETVCVAGQDICSAEPGLPSPEVCDLVDNDCNGTVDDGIAPAPTACGTGTCASTGSLTCVSGDLVDDCQPGLPTPESCDLLDNDCNGTADDGIAPIPTSCGTGVCAATGSLTCAAGELVDDCEPGQAAAFEFCNGVDDNCNGQIDDNPPPFFGGLEVCGLGECTRVVELSCIGGEWVDDGDCDPLLGATQEILCNEIDEDCNGVLEPVVRTPEESALCEDGQDNDCDGLLDAPDLGCPTPCPFETLWASALSRWDLVDHSRQEDFESNVWSVRQFTNSTRVRVNTPRFFPTQYTNFPVTSSYEVEIDSNVWVRPTAVTDGAFFAALDAVWEGSQGAARSLEDIFTDSGCETTDCPKVEHTAFLEIKMGRFGVELPTVAYPGCTFVGTTAPQASPTGPATSWVVRTTSKWVDADITVSGCRWDFASLSDASFVTKCEWAFVDQVARGDGCPQGTRDACRLSAEATACCVENLDPVVAQANDCDGSACFSECVAGGGGFFCFGLCPAVPAYPSCLETMPSGRFNCCCKTAPDAVFCSERP
jgi:hypothetical protein